MSYTYRYSAPANGPVVITANDLGMTTQTGYKVLGAQGWNLGNQVMRLYQITPGNTGDGRVAAFYNTTGNSVTGTFTIYVTYAKNT